MRQVAPAKALPREFRKHSWPHCSAVAVRLIVAESDTYRLHVLWQLRSGFVIAINSESDGP